MFIKLSFFNLTHISLKLVVYTKNKIYFLIIITYITFFTAHDYAKRVCGSQGKGLSFKPNEHILLKVSL